MPEGFASSLEKCLLAVGDAQRVGTNHAHAVCVHVAKTLAEALETRQRPCRDFLVDPAVLLDTRGKADHLPQPVDDDDLPVRIAGNDHVETVGPEVDRRQDVGDGLRRGAGLRNRHSGRSAGAHQAAEKEDPQPHVVAALGLRMTN